VGDTVVLGLRFPHVSVLKVVSSKRDGEAWQVRRLHEKVQCTIGGGVAYADDLELDALEVGRPCRYAFQIDDRCVVTSHRELDMRCPLHMPDLDLSGIRPRANRRSPSPGSPPCRPAVRHH